MSTVEIKGKKFTLNQSVEITEEYSVGMPVRILTKGYSDYSAHSGIILSIDNFKNSPAVNVLYLKTDYSSSEILIKTISEYDKETEITQISEIDSLLTRDMVISHLDEKINKMKIELDTLIKKKEKIEKVLSRIFG